MERRLDTSHRREASPAIAAWRRDVLLRAGFSAELARDLAHDERVDLHDLLRLVDDGCPPGLAARILAPL